ncbi:MAG: adenine phosphoribosyltransferase [Flavobacteriales bacterium]|nr:adenine phosphoribosyltransferase [Flavobacteriales bacterium]
MSLENKIKTVIRDVQDFPKQGIVFKDITPILKDPSLCKEIIHAFEDQILQLKPDAIMAIESRGFLFGMMMALHFNIPFIPVRKKGKLPYKTISYSYHLEYGSATVEIHEDAIAKGSKVLIHDDLLATGGTAIAAAELVKMQEGEVAGFSFVVALDFLNGANRLKKYSNNIFSLVHY